MKFCDTSKWARAIASCLIAAICGLSVFAIERANSASAPAAGTGAAVVLQADGVAPPPPPPTPPKQSAAS